MVKSPSGAGNSPPNVGGCATLADVGGPWRRLGLPGVRHGGRVRACATLADTPEWGMWRRGIGIFDWIGGGHGFSLRICIIGICLVLNYCRTLGEYKGDFEGDFRFLISDFGGGIQICETWVAVREFRTDRECRACHVDAGQ